MKTEAEQLKALDFFGSKDGTAYSRAVIGGANYLIRSEHGWGWHTTGWAMVKVTWPPEVYYPDPLTALAHAELMNWGQD